MSKWKYLYGCASLVAALSVTSAVKASFVVSLIPDVAATNADQDNASLPESDVTITGQNASITQIGDSVTYDIEVTIGNTDGNEKNEAFYLYLPAFKSTTSASGGLQGVFDSNVPNGNGPGETGSPNISIINQINISSTLSSPGVEFNHSDPGQYGSTSDPLTNTAESSSATSPTTPLQFSSGSAAYWRGYTTNSGSLAGLTSGGYDGYAVPTKPTGTTGNGTNPWTLELGQITWTDTVLPGNGSTATASILNELNASNSIVLQYYQDAAGGSNPSGPLPTTGHNADSAGSSDITFSNASSVISGPVVNTPEPASLGLMGLGITALGIRSRRKSAAKA